MAGEIHDAAVALRRSSSTEGQWLGARMSCTNGNNLWDPLVFAHGFLTLCETSAVLSKACGFLHKQFERSLCRDDQTFGIDGHLESIDSSEPLTGAQGCGGADAGRGPCSR